jgi:hypothetical protein
LNKFERLKKLKKDRGQEREREKLRRRIKILFISLLKQIREEERN